MKDALTIPQKKRLILKIDMNTLDIHDRYKTRANAFALYKNLSEAAKELECTVSQIQDAVERIITAHEECKFRRVKKKAKVEWRRRAKELGVSPEEYIIKVSRKIPALNSLEYHLNNSLL